MSRNERVQALQILTQVIGHHSTLAQGLSAATPMTKELCFGVCRHYIRLSMIADLLVDKRPKSIEVWVAIVMGLYQLHYMQLPDYAVVKETVAVLEKIKKNWAKGLVNAVLRAFCRQHQQLVASLADNPQFLYGHPKHLAHRLQQSWPNDWQNIMLANDMHPPMTLRVNVNKSSVSEYLSVLAQNKIPAQAHPVVSSAIILTTPCDVRSLPGFAEGWVSVQDAAAQLAVPLLALKPGLRILDACCAPGGKTCHILESEAHLSTCVALDVDERRLKRVHENLKRQQVQAQVLKGDALQPGQWWDKQLFDRILLDAPCSATGVIRRHADIKLLRTDDEIATIVRLQYKMLRILWPLLAPQGILVYATCSVLPEENEQQIAQFVAEHDGCQVLPIMCEWGQDTGHGRQILPGDQGMDGFFYSVLVKHQF
jgi:16S rRNA (cytosine967-C5)-methyltransferase